MDKELYRNGSGYADPTAYQAMKGMNSMDVRRFEIWSYVTTTGIERMGIVMAGNKNTALMFALYDKPISDGIQIVTMRGEKYMSPILMTFCTEKNIGQYIQDIPKEKEEEIMSAFLEAFDLSDHEVKKRAEVLPENSGYKEEMELKLCAVTTERDVYQGLYRELLDKITG